MSNNIPEKITALAFLKSRFELSDEIQTQVIEITPEIAKSLLFLSEGNRNIKRAHVANLANSITQNRFPVTNNAISFDTNFSLRDGHHRLKAIVIAKKPVNCLVAVNIPTENFRYVDAGINRSMSDKVSIFSEYDYGFNITAKTISVANGMLRCGTNGINVKQISRDSVFVEKFIFDNKEGIAFTFENCSIGDKTLSRAPLLSAIACSYKHISDKEKLQSFCSQFFYGESARVKTSLNHPFVARDWFLSYKFDDYVRTRIGSITNKNSGFAEFAAFYAVQCMVQKFVSESSDFSGRVDGGLKVINKELKEVEKKPIIYQPIIDFEAYRKSV